MNILWIGLGVMGGPMAGHLSTTQHALTAYNRSADKRTAWANHYAAHTIDSLSSLDKPYDVVISCVSNDPDLFAIMQTVLPLLPANAVWVDHSTVSANVVAVVQQLAMEHQVSFIDAPVSGGQQGAEQGCLTVMAGGCEQALMRVKPLLNNYAKCISHMGASGSGQLTKMVNQICAAAVIQGLAEGLNFAQQVGLDGPQLLQTLTAGAAQSWQMDNRGLTMLKGEFDFGFAVDLMRKDLNIVKEQAKKENIPIPVTEVIDQFYKSIQGAGHGHWDTSSLITCL